MDTFRQCVEDLDTIGRMLELPHGRDIAVEMLRELTPYLKELAALQGRDPTGAVKRILAHVDYLKAEVYGGESAERRDSELRRSGTQRVA